MDDEFVEGVVCKESDIGENEMKVFELGPDGGKVLIVKQKGVISALGTKCTHYGAPLVTGALGDGRVRCPWHGACFNIANGDIEDFPGLDSLPCYQVTTGNGDVKVKASKALLAANTRVKTPRLRDANNTATFVVVGGGPAGANCVETLRQEGFSGRIVFVCGEPHLPYDRVKLSKALDMTIDKIALRRSEFYAERDIEVLLSTQLTELNAAKKSVTLSNGTSVQYDKLFLATGSSPRRIPTPGLELGNIFVLRSIDDANRIFQALTPESRVVVLGSSFIGLEAASMIAPKVKSLAVVAIEKTPFELILGGAVGQRIQGLFEEKGVKFHLSESIVEFRGEGGALKEVVLKGGAVLPADVCLIGVGVVPNTGYLAAAGVALQRSGAIAVNEYLQTELPDVFAGGDIAHAPVLPGLEGGAMRAAIGHWGLANYHGHMAALNMLGAGKPLNAVPFFWTMLFGKGFRYTGFAVGFEEVDIIGDLEGMKFVALYVVRGKVHAVATVASDPIAARFAELLNEGKELTKEQVKEALGL